MNATDFISKSEYAELCEKYKRQDELKYGADIRTKDRNWYQIQIRGYWYDKIKYRTYVWIDYNYKDSRGELYGNNIGGGDIGEFIADDYDGFKKMLNKRLCRFPDYDELEQMTLF